MTVFESFSFSSSSSFENSSHSFTSSSEYAVRSNFAPKGSMPRSINCCIFSLLTLTWSFISSVNYKHSFNLFNCQFFLSLFQFYSKVINNLSNFASRLCLIDQFTGCTISFNAFYIPRSMFPHFKNRNLFALQINQSVHMEFHDFELLFKVRFINQFTCLQIMDSP